MSNIEFGSVSHDAAVVGQKLAQIGKLFAHRIATSLLALHKLNGHLTRYDEWHKLLLKNVGILILKLTIKKVNF
ncbi:MAG: hypothetical protein NTU97_01400 [Candidatus Magasanikbacteria bacterium]|nr:hypothetical protein [Candidatus Magasanikbacteria bacterium]